MRYRGGMEMVTVSRHINLASAELDAARLEAAGFAVLRHDESSPFAGGVGTVQVQVPADQVEDARALLAADAPATSDQDTGATGK
jgi:hypothetical protein